MEELFINGSQLFDIGELQGCHTSGKNQNETKFSPGQGIVKELQKMSENFAILTQIRELSGNVVVTTRFFSSDD